MLDEVACWQLTASKVPLQSVASMPREVAKSTASKIAREQQELEQFKAIAAAHETTIATQKRQLDESAAQLTRAECRVQDLQANLDQMAVAAKKKDREIQASTKLIGEEEARPGNTSRLRIRLTFHHRFSAQTDS